MGINNAFMAMGSYHPSEDDFELPRRFFCRHKEVVKELVKGTLSSTRYSAMGTGYVKPPDRL